MEELSIKKNKTKKTIQEVPPALTTQFLSLFPNENQKFQDFLQSSPEYQKIISFVTPFENFSSYSEKVISPVGTFESKCVLCRSYVGMVGKKFRKFKRFATKRQNTPNIFKIFLKYLKKIIEYCLSITKYFKTILMVSTSDPEIIYQLFTCLFQFVNKVFSKSKTCTLADIDQYFDIFESIQVLFYSNVFHPKIVADMNELVRPRINIQNLRKQFSQYFSTSLTNSKKLRSTKKNY